MTVWRLFLPAQVRFLWSILVQYLTVNLLSLASLAIGYAACILIGLYVYDELNFDRYIRDGDRVFVISASYGPKGQPLVDSDITAAGLSTWMRDSLPELESVARLNPVDWPIRTAKKSAYEHFFWADPNLFDVLQLPFLRGDPEHALSQEGSVVMTRKMAIRYFGRDDVIGQPIILNDQTVAHVTGILRDYPSNTHLGREMFVSGQGSYTMLSIFDSQPNFQWPSNYIYLKLKPGASRAQAETRLMPILIQHWQSEQNQPERLRLVPLLALHFSPIADGEMKPRGHMDTVIAMICVAALILTLAIGNFTGLMIARIDERGYEMAVRKALGARRRDLVVQILAEATSVSLIAMFLALALVERLLPLINVRLDLGMDLWSRPIAVLTIGIFTAVITGVAGGLYPALVLSAVFPVEGLRGGGRHEQRGSPLGRQGWLVLQFALSITLLVCAHTVYRQWHYATNQGLNFDAEHVVLMNDVPDTVGGKTFKRDVSLVAGVAGVAQSRWVPMEKEIRPAWAKSRDGSLIKFTRHSVDENFFTLYKVPILAGHNFTGTIGVPGYPHDIIINATAMRALGFHGPSDAIGRQIDYAADRKQLHSRIVGVVDDMRFSTVRAPMRPMIFDNFSDFFSVLSVRLSPDFTPGTLATLDQLWMKDKPRNGTIDRQFFSAYLAKEYSDMYQQRQIFSFFSFVGLCLSGLCLIGLSIFLARSRRREIAIRRALGATFDEILKLRLSPFIKPLILSNLIAWPLASALMLYWLNSFADHVDLYPLSFLGATAITSTVAFATLAIHAISVSRDRPARPLRHE